MNALPEKNRGIPVALALGGNLGDVEAAFRFALQELAAHGVTHLRMARPVSTAPVDCVPGTPDFLNSAVTGYWGGSAEELLALTQRIEIAAGRPAVHGRNASRVLDIDIILFGDFRIATPALTVPHPAARRRRFVMEPLAEIVPDWLFPDSNESVAEAWRRIR